MAKTAPEGYLFIAAPIALALVLLLALGPWWALPPLVVTAFMVYFFRDPERKAPPEGGYLSPADGRVISVSRVTEDEFLKREVLRVSIFMSPLDVHVNRSPCSGRVDAVKRTPGGYRAAYRDDATETNENTAMLLECDGGPILVRQVAGFLARRTVCRKAPGDVIGRGERYGIIKFGSRLDVYLSPEVTLRVAPGQKVRAGETVIAVLEAGA